MILTAVIDRFEEELAVVVLDRGGEMLIPIAHLPQGVKEGDVLNVDISIDTDETKARLEKMKKLKDELNEGSRGNI